MISLLHTWGTHPRGYRRSLERPPRRAGFQIRWGLEDMPEDRNGRADPRTVHAARGADPELGRRFLE
jgi:hypothetical protein